MFKAPVDLLPLVGSAPLQAPVAEQLVALVVDQVKVLLPPADTLVGEALKAIVGAGAGGAVAPYKVTTST